MSDERARKGATMPLRVNELGELQLTVMNILWTCREATVHEVLAAFPESRRPAYTTVLSVLQKLETYGLVEHRSQEGSRRFQYRPLVSAHDAREEILQDVLHRLFAGSPTLLVRHILETEGYTLKELREIRRVVEERIDAINGKVAS